jgi:outer membrane protein assembly factor BamA
MQDNRLQVWWFWPLVVGSLLWAGKAACEAPLATADLGREALDQESSAAVLANGNWGRFPTPADSVTAQFQNRPIPLWEYALLVPYRIVSFPIWAVSRGLTVSAVHLAETDFASYVGKFFRGFRGPFGTRWNPNFTAGGTLGTGGGLTIGHGSFFGPGNKVKIRWQSTTNSSHKLSLGGYFSGSGKTTLQLGGGWRVRPNARYFGIGPLAAESDESRFLQEMSWAGASVDRKIGSGFSFEIGGMYSTVGNRGPETDEPEPPLAELFAEDLQAGRIPGYGQRSDGWTASFSLTHDNTGETGRPDRGGLRRVKASYFTGVGGGDVGFWTYRAEIQQFLPLWTARRALALRTHLSWIENTGDDPVPFQRLLTNDDPDLLRGYDDYRWRDRGLAALTVEYRWPVWTYCLPPGAGVDAYLFTDIGQVFGDLEEISGGNLTESFGGGLRVIGFGGSFAARFEIAVSQEETLLRVRGDQLFQFTRGGLYHGRDPVPAR